MPAIKDNPRWEIFAQLLAKGWTQHEAYVKAGYDPDGDNIDTLASRLAAKPIVKQRLSQLIDKNGALQEISRSQLIDFLIEVINTPVGKIDENSRVAQEAESIFNGNNKRTKIRSCDKLKALEILNRMVGYNQPERTENKTTITLERIVDTSVLQQLTNGYAARQQIIDIPKSKTEKLLLENEICLQPS